MEAISHRFAAGYAPCKNKRQIGPRIKKPTDSDPWALDCVQSISSSGSFRGLRTANRLDNHPIANRLGANLDPHDTPVDDSPDLLNVRLELARGDTGRLGTDAAKVLRLPAMGDLVAEGGLLTGEIANAGHKDS